MDPTTYGTLQQELKKKPFSSDKKSVLQNYSQYFFSAQQCVGVLEGFPHASDKIEALSIIAPIHIQVKVRMGYNFENSFIPDKQRLVTITGEDGKMIVKAFPFANDQVKAVRLIASHVYDPANKYAILDAITFRSNKDEAKQILDTTPSAPPPTTAYCGNYPSSISQPPAAPYVPPPQQQAPYQPPNPGGYPPPPAQGGYPPPPAQGTYPPPQGGYPPPPGPAAGYGQPPPGGVNFQFGVGGPPAGGPPGSQQQPGEINMQFGLGGFGMPTGNISFQTNPSQPPQWP